MNTFNRGVAIRALVYTLALASTVALASWPIVLAEALLLCSGIVLWHRGEVPPYTSTMITATTLTVATAICAKASTQTLWFAHAVELLGVPLWLLPGYILIAQLVLDVDRFVKYNSVAKASLPD